MGFDEQNKPHEESHEASQKSVATASECEFCVQNCNSDTTSTDHKISHLQAQGKNLVTELNPMSKDKFMCFICKKDFPSRKSLCGHMRTHPDRNWRGVHPPIPSLPAHSHDSSSNLTMEKNENHYYSNAIATPKKEEPVDLLKHLRMLPGWQFGKRRKKRVYRKEEITAAQILVDISHDTWPHGVHLKSVLQMGHFGNNMKGASNDMNTRDEAGTGGVKDLVRDFGEMKMSKENNNENRRKLTVKLKNPYSRVKDEAGDGYKCDICCRYYPTILDFVEDRLSHAKERNLKRKSSDGAREADQSSKKVHGFDLKELPEDT
ncbi:uncharacterized protein LOC113874531 [Abrus precatorius]|uniref:Uncharacterized protein LOC113874531 n=1 Tax=Abrus precatorius TaxID=3816 RepID=A0A8B8MMT8_ABRPR|nr:uncharacterized protein LOC113874531 [Abrus precatorius]